MTVNLLFLIFISITYVQGAQVYFYQMIKTTESKLRVTKMMSDVKNVAECTAACSLMENGCNGIRYNLPTAPPKTCQLGTYDIENDFAWAYNPGDFATLWRVRYSSNKCFAKFPGMTGSTPGKEFCSRMGGQLPELRRPDDNGNVNEATSGTPLGLRQDAVGVWRWDSDGEEADFVPEPIAGSNATAPCARKKGAVVYQIPCGSRIHFACQFC